MDRAQGAIRRWCVHNRVDHLGTLTNREEIYSWREINRRVRKFLERKAASGNKRPMLLAAEPHPGGHGYHVQFAVRGFLDVGLLRQWWPLKRYGNIDIQWHHEADLTPKKIARYVGKYVGKQLDAEELHGCEPRPAGAHRYWKTQGHDPVPTEKRFATWADLWAWVLRHYGEPKPPQWWTSDDGYRPEGCCLWFPDSCIRAPPAARTERGVA